MSTQTTHANGVCMLHQKVLIRKMLSQAAILSRPICNGTNAKIDGSFIATALETASVIVLYLAWQGITEDYWGEDVYFQ